MSTSTIMEIGFNLAYLVAIYALVVLMYRSRSGAQDERRPFTVAFLLLAIGDTGHVGFRVVAYLTGGLESNSQLVGLGALTTSITVTAFYMLMMEVWRRRAGVGRNWTYWIAIAAGIARFAIMAFPGNDWGNTMPPLDFSYLRNVPLTAMGIVLAILCINSGARRSDPFLSWIGILVCISFAFYLPVILFIRSVPALGMLMIPKTLAYVAMAIVGYRRVYRPRHETPVTA